MEKLIIRKNSGVVQNNRYSKQQADSTNKQNFKQFRVDSNALKEQLNIINNQRKSLTRQSINDLTKELQNTRERRRTSKVISHRQSFPLRKESIIQNLVSKLDAEEELRQILQKKYPQRNSLLSSSVTIARESSSPQINNYLLDKVKAYELQIINLKRQLEQSQLKIQRLEHEKGKPELRKRIKDRGTQTEVASAEPNKQDFIQNLEKTLQVLNSSGKYTLY